MRLDKLLQEFFIGFGLSSSATMWNSMHEKHHSTPQKVGYDLDIDTTPLVAFHRTALVEKETAKKGKKTGFSMEWFKYQAWTFLPVTCLFVMLFWLFYLHPRKVIRTGRWREGVWMLASHFVTTTLIMKAANFDSIATGYLAFWFTRWIGGMYLFGNFSLSHTHTPTVDEHASKNWVRFACEHTVDIAPGDIFVDWWMGYLNCQVIHHLFPSMPQFHQPAVSRHFEVFCEKWGLQYEKVSYWEALKLTFSNLDAVGHEIIDPTTVLSKED